MLSLGDVHLYYRKGSIASPVIVLPHGFAEQDSHTKRGRIWLRETSSVPRVLASESVKPTLANIVQTLTGKHLLQSSGTSAGS